MYYNCKAVSSVLIYTGDRGWSSDRWSATGYTRVNVATYNITSLKSAYSLLLGAAWPGSPCWITLSSPATNALCLIVMVPGCPIRPTVCE